MLWQSEKLYSFEMKLTAFWSILILLTFARASSGLNVSCVHGCWICSRPRNRYCNINDVEVAAERDRLVFDYGNSSANLINVLRIDSRGGDRGFDTIPTEIFEIFPNLENFTMTTALKVISPNDWQNATNLKVLELYHVQVDLNAYTFNGLDKLEKLSLAWSSKAIDVIRIRPNVFTGMNNLKKLFIRSKIRTIEDIAFDLPNLITLDLYNNKLSTLSDLTFSKLPNLQELDLSKNKLNHFDPNVFSGLNNLRKLDVSQNEIQTIEDVTFDLPNLIKLNLNNNKLSTLSDLAFSKLPNLQELNLRFNKLTHIWRNIFAGMNSLKELNLYQNEIHTIQDDAFDLPNLIKLDLSDNKLSTLLDLVFSKTPNLQEVNLGYNKLTHIGQSLYCLTNIKRIELHYNSIDDIDLLEIAKLSHLEFLNLESSGFSFRSNKTAKTKNTSLKTLNLAANNLKNSLDLHQLSIFNGLSDLDLRYNPYTRFDFRASDITTIWPNIRSLNLVGTRMNQNDTNLIELDDKLKVKSVELRRCFWE